MIGRTLAGLASPIAIFMPFAALAAPVEGYEGYGHHMMWGGGWFGWILGPLMMVLVIGGVVAVVVCSGTGSGRAKPHPRNGTGGTRTDPLDILKETVSRAARSTRKNSRTGAQVLGG